MLEPMRSEQASQRFAYPVNWRWLRHSLEGTDLELERVLYFRVLWGKAGN
jgi:hypothetical protein